jgi:hypothetical protein
MFPQVSPPQRLMISQRIAQLLLSVAVTAACFLFGATSEFYNAALISAFFGGALFSVCIVHLRLFPTVVDLAAIVLGTAVFVFLDFKLLRYPPKIMAWFSFLGLSSLLVLALRLVWAPAANRRFHFLAVVPSLLFISSDWFASTFLAWTEKAHPRVLDLNLFVFDASLHVQFPFLLGQAFKMWDWFKVVSLVAYIALPIPIAIVYSGHLLRRETRAISAMLAFLVTGPIGILFYNLLPAMGPAHIFRGDFPWHPLPLDSVRRLVLEPIAIAGPRNAIPSLHMGWVLLAWWFSRGLSVWERAVVAFFVFFTVCSTLGTGEHYFVDLIAALPFALLIESLCMYKTSWRPSPRLFCFLFGLGLTLAWLAVLRFAPKVFLISPFFGWLACILTIGSCLLYERTLFLGATQPVAVPAPSEPELKAAR